MGTEPTLAEVIREAIDSRLLDVHVAMPAKVVIYDASTQTIEAQPMIRRAILDTTGKVQHEDLPIIPNVPVLFPRSAAFSATWPLAAGDFVLLVFNSSAIGNWRESGDISNPGDLRRHDLSYPIALPGIAPKGATIPTASNAALLEVSGVATHVQVGASATEFVGRADKIETVIGDLASAILNAAPSPGDGGAAIQTAAKANLSGLGWGSGGTDPPTNSTAATKLKSE